MPRRQTKNDMSKYKNQACQWKKDDIDGGWDTGCGEKFEFTNDGPKENGVRFCYHCGKPVTLAGDRQPAMSEVESAKGVGISDLLSRARQPKEGDTYLKGDFSCVVKSVGDGQVWYDIQHDEQEPSHHQMTIEDFVTLATKTIHNGALFKAA